MSDEAIFVAASGALVQEMRLEILSNNLANIDTIGYKADRAVFSNYLLKNRDIPLPSDSESLNDNDIQPMVPSTQSNIQVKFEGIKTDFSPGQIRSTGNPFDLALEGDGFFCIETPQGIQQYTRKGNFKLSDDRNLVTQDGSTVMGKNGRSIELDGRDISIDEQGNVMIDGLRRDSIRIVDFPKPYSLLKVGDASFIPANPAVTGEIAENVKIKQGFIEMSNVNPIKAMTEMIEVHRAFESYQKVIRSMDEVLSRSIDEVGRAL